VEALAVAPSAVSPYANLLGVYSLGLYATRPRVWLGPALLPFGVVAYFVALGPITWVTPAGALFSWLLVWALGYSTARRREEHQVAQALMRERLVAEERTRMAREVHDLVGHTVNVMLVQVGAARRVLDRDPSRGRELLSTAESVGREALDELDRVLGVLRDGGGQPGLDDLPDLARRLREAGIDITVRVDASGLNPGLDRAAYRIVQEALTNALEHGRATSATVAIGLEDGVLVVEVCDDGKGPEPGYTPGRGLVGMRERAEMFGGTVRHGGLVGPGFQVRAELRPP
jgi:signal transduction histidine kinase